MDVVNIGRSRRFLRERPMHVNLFDRPRLVVDLLCLEPNQEESRRGFDRSDSMLVLIEGEARLRAGPQIESLQEMDAVMVPPGQEYTVQNTGAGQMTAVVIVTPKPTRADEVRVPGDTRPFRTVRPDRDESAGEGAGMARSGFVSEGRPRPAGSFPGRDDRPQRERPFQSREGGRPRGAYPRRDNNGERSALPRRDDKSERAAYPRRDGGPGRAPYPRRADPPGGGRNESGGFERRPYRRDSEGEGERGRPRRGTTGARQPRRNEGEGPVWYPKPKPVWRPRGAPPSAPGRGKPPAGRSRDDGRPPRRDSDGFSRGETSRGSTAPRGRGNTYDSRSGTRSGTSGRFDNRGGGRKTGDARRASRGQGPLSGRRGPGRSEPRT